MPKPCYEVLSIRATIATWTNKRGYYVSTPRSWVRHHVKIWSPLSGNGRYVVGFAEIKSYGGGGYFAVDRDLINELRKADITPKVGQKLTVELVEEAK